MGHITRIVIEPYQEAWTTLFQKEKTKLKELFQALPILIFHIGSTAIVGAKAKPIIDILIVVTIRSTIFSYRDALKELGYDLKGECGVRGRVFAQKRGPQWFHLHFFEEGDPEIARLLRFVSYLNRHQKMRDQYVRLKEELAPLTGRARRRDDLAKSLASTNSANLTERGIIKEIDYMAAKEAETWVQLPDLGPKKSSWTSEEILQALDDNLHLEMTYFAKYVPSRENLFEPDVTVIQSSVKSDTFNVVLSAHFEERRLSERVAHVIELFHKKELPFTWWVGPLDTPQGLSQELMRQGLKLKEGAVAMYKALDGDLYRAQEGLVNLYEARHCQIEAKRSERRFGKVAASTNSPNLTERGIVPLTHRLDVKRVLNEDDFFDFDSVHVGSSGSPEVFEKLFRPIPPVLYREGSPWEMYTGYKDGKPIVTGILVFHAHVAGIYYFTTLSQERRKGYGTEMMHSLLKRAKDKGYFLSILHASQMGKRLYERFGFKACGSYSEFGF